MGTLHFLRAVTPQPEAVTSCFQAFDRELDYLYWTLQRLGARPADTEDLLQDIFAVLHKKWPTLDTTPPTPPLAVRRRVSAWSGPTVGARCAKRRATAWTRRTPLPIPRTTLQEQQSLALLSAALERVPEARRSVLMLHDLDGVEVSRDRSSAFDHAVRRLREAPQRTEGARFGGALRSKGRVRAMKAPGRGARSGIGELAPFRTAARSSPNDVRARVLARSRAIVLGGEELIPPPPLAGRQNLNQYRSSEVADCRGSLSPRRSLSSPEQWALSLRSAVARLTIRRRPSRAGRSQSQPPFLTTRSLTPHRKPRQSPFGAPRPPSSPARHAPQTRSARRLHCFSARMLPMRATIFRSR